jgi:hypothetical protein
MMNRAADAWADATSNGQALADALTVGDCISYDDAEEMGEQVWAELRRALPSGLTIVDEGDGHEVRISDDLREELIAAVEAADLVYPESVCDAVLGACDGSADPRAAALAELAAAIAND